MPTYVAIASNEAISASPSLHHRLPLTGEPVAALEQMPAISVRQLLRCRAWFHHGSDT